MSGSKYESIVVRFSGSDDPGKAKEAIRGCSSVGRAPALQAGGQEFESLHLHHTVKAVKKGRASKRQETPIKTGS